MSLVTNEAGGRQAKIEEWPTAVDPHAFLRMCYTLGKGLASHGRDNWRKISVDDHLAHAIRHIYLHLAGDTGGEPHLTHAACRLMFADALTYGPYQSGEE